MTAHDLPNNLSTLSELQSRFGNKPLEFQAVRPRLSPKRDCSPKRVNSRSCSCRYDTLSKNDHVLDNLGPVFSTVDHPADPIFKAVMIRCARAASYHTDDRRAQDFCAFYRSQPAGGTQIVRIIRYLRGNPQTRNV